MADYQKASEEENDITAFLKDKLIALKKELAELKKARNASLPFSEAARTFCNRQQTGQKKLIKAENTLRSAWKNSPRRRGYMKKLRLPYLRPVPR